MKLTNTIRDAFVRAAMDDVPSIDYAEKMRDLAVKTAVAALPPKVRAIYADKELRDYVTTHFAYGVIGMQLPGLEDVKGLAEALKPLEGLRDAQVVSLQELRQKLRGVAYSATTRVKLVELLPEFEKYLPADEQAAMKTNLPALANVVTDFVKAGWPKGGKKAASARAHPAV